MNQSSVNQTAVKSAETGSGDIPHNKTQQRTNEFFRLKSKPRSLRPNDGNIS